MTGQFGSALRAQESNLLVLAERSDHLAKNAIPIRKRKQTLCSPIQNGKVYPDQYDPSYSMPLHWSCRRRHASDRARYFSSLAVALICRTSHWAKSRRAKVRPASSTNNSLIIMSQTRPTPNSAKETKEPAHTRVGPT